MEQNFGNICGNHKKKPISSHKTTGRTASTFDTIRVILATKGFQFVRIVINRLAIGTNSYIEI